MQPLSAPFGFVNCNGAVYNYVENPEYKVLFESIGNFYNEGDENTAAGEFRVPDIRGRVTVGRGTGLVGSGRRFRGLGETGGWENIQKHLHLGLEGKARLRHDGTNVNSTVEIYGRNDSGQGTDDHVSTEGTDRGDVWVELSEAHPAFNEEPRTTSDVRNSDLTLPVTGLVENDGIDPRADQNESQGNMMPYIVLDYIIKI